MSELSLPRYLSVAVSDHDHARGPADAAVTMVEYGDFECPFCAMAYADVADIQRRLGSRLRFVYRHFPRPEHPHARHAAEAAECAGAQNTDAFWAMHDQLFEHQFALDDAHLVEYAAAIGLDLPRFSHDMAQHTYRDRVHEDERGARESGVHGTPTFFINGERYVGRARPRDLYREILRHVGDVDDDETFDEVDEASAESFPASDPPAWIREHM